MKAHPSLQGLRRARASRDKYDQPATPENLSLQLRAVTITILFSGSQRPKKQKLSVYNSESTAGVPNTESPRLAGSTPDERAQNLKIQSQAMRWILVIVSILNDWDPKSKGSYLRKWHQRPTRRSQNKRNSELAASLPVELMQWSPHSGLQILVWEFQKCWRNHSTWSSTLEPPLHWRWAGGSL